MNKINMDQIKALRDKTKSSIADCKDALEKAAGDTKKALKFLIAKGATISEDKKQRSTENGVIEAYIHSDKKTGVLLELLCETDFAANTDDFRDLAHELAMQIAAANPKDIKELLAQPYIRDEKMIVKDLMDLTVSKVKENIKINKFCRYQI